MRRKKKMIKDSAMWLHPAIRLALQMGVYVPEEALYKELSNKLMEQLAILEEDAIDKLGDIFWNEYEERIKKGFSLMSRSAIKKRLDKEDERLSDTL